MHNERGFGCGLSLFTYMLLRVEAQGSNLIKLICLQFPFTLDRVLAFSFFKGSSKGQAKWSFVGQGSSFHIEMQLVAAVATEDFFPELSQTLKKKKRGKK